MGGGGGGGGGVVGGGGGGGGLVPLHGSASLLFTYSRTARNIHILIIGSLGSFFLS